MAERNQAVGGLLNDIARLLTLQHADPFRARAFTEAARSIEALPRDVLSLHRAGALEDVPGVGPSIAGIVGEFLETGRSVYYEQLKLELAPESPELLDLPSVGPTRARTIAQHLGITQLADLERAAAEGRLRRLPGFGEKLEHRILAEATRALRGMASRP